MTREYIRAMVVVTCGIIGIILAIMLQMFYADQIIINEYVTGTITLRAIQAFFIIFWLVIGGILSAVAK